MYKIVPKNKKKKPAPSPQNTAGLSPFTSPGAASFLVTEERGALSQLGIDFQRKSDFSQTISRWVKLRTCLILITSA